MRKPIQWTALASIVLGGLAFLPRIGAADQPANTGAAANAQGHTQFTLPAGIVPKDLNADHAIRSAFGAYEKAALKKDGYKDVVDCLVDQDRQRVKDYKEQKTDAL